MITVSSSTGNRFQYSAENNKIYVSFTATLPRTTGKLAAFGINVKLRTFYVGPPQVTVAQPTVQALPKRDYEMIWPFDDDENDDDLPFKEPEVIYLTEYNYDYVNVTVKMEEIEVP